MPSARSRRDKKDLGRDDGDLAKITSISPTIFVVVSPARKLIHPMTSTTYYTVESIAGAAKKKVLAIEISKFE